LKTARENAHLTFAGRSVLILGGSTSRDLAADFMQMVLPPSQRGAILNAWQANNTQGHELFPASGKQAVDFEEMYKASTMQPLLSAGWEFTQILGPDAGCRDCNSSYTNIDYVATIRGGASKNDSAGGISYEFSWKPEIFASLADTTGFQTRYCKRHYDVVHIGKGLHDAAFKSAKDLTPVAIEERFEKLAALVKCLPESTLVVLRTPYRSKNAMEEGFNQITTAVLRKLVSSGSFGAQRSVLIDGNLLTSATSHPDPWDTHHYESPLGRTYWNLVLLVAQKFFQRSGLGGLSDGDTRRWNRCGVSVAAN